MNRLQRDMGWVVVQRRELATVVAVPVADDPSPRGRHERRVVDHELGESSDVSVPESRDDDVHDLNYVLAKKLHDERRGPGAFGFDELSKAFLSNEAVPVSGTQTQSDCSCLTT